MIIGAIVSFVVILGLLVVIHEIGHFVAAKLFGVGVEEFGLGYPPRLYGMKRGDTIYSLNWIPVGGFVKIQGVLGGDQKDMTVDTSSSRSFMTKPRWQRLLILCAGIVMNLVLSVVLFTTSYLVGARVMLDNVPAQARISQAAITVIDLAEETTAYQAGLRVNDNITAINEQSVTNLEQVRAQINNKAIGDTVIVTVQRGQEVINISTQLVPINETTNPGIGAYFADTGIVRLPLWTALQVGVKQTVQMAMGIFLALYQAIASLFTQQPGPGEISGPLGIASLTYQATQLGWSYVIQFAAMLSVNLAIFNLLPIPALDGGRIAFLLVEWVRRKPVNQKIETIIHNIGFILLLFLIMVVTIKDVINLF